MSAFQNDQQALALRLRGSRIASGLSQAQVAAATGLGRVAIAEIEAGRRKVSSLELAALSKAYGQEVSFFLGEPEIGAEAYSSPTVSYLARAAKQLAPQDQEQLLRFAEYLKAESKKRSQSRRR
jgi:transcriptional regulator with XRE-family HTH domain